MMDERLDRIESKLAFAEDAIDALNMTVFRQQQQIDRLQKHLLELQKQISGGSSGERRDLREEIPPHY